MAKRRGPGKRYTSQEKQRILSAAKKEGLTGEQVAKRFGVAQLTFYRWRGPVRGAKARAARATGSSAEITLDENKVRAEVRLRLGQMLPEIIRQEVARFIEGLGGSPVRRRRRVA